MACSIVIIGCAFFGGFDPATPGGYESQKQIVKQGYSRVPTPHGEWRAIYFGYDRNRDYSRYNDRDKGHGVDLIEYKRLRIDGGWEFHPFLILIDENYDGYVDWVYLDRDFNATTESVYALDDIRIHIERVDFFGFRPFEIVPAPLD